MARLVAPTTPIVVMLHGLPAAKEQNAARILRAARARVVAVSQDTADQISATRALRRSASSARASMWRPAGGEP
jgi:hypothetical protein